MPGVAAVASVARRGAAVVLSCLHSKDDLLSVKCEELLGKHSAADTAECAVLYTRQIRVLQARGER